MKINRLHALTLLAGAFMVAGCHTDMWRQPKVGSQQKSEFFSDGMGDRPPVEGTVAYGKLREDDQKYKGREGKKLTTTLPATLVINGEKLNSTTDLAKILARGKERYAIFCSHCHGAVGDGKGMIAQRGLDLRRSPASYHTDRLRKMPIGHFYDTITNGYGIMFAMASKIEPDDRWAISSYIRVLQRAQNATPQEAEAGMKVQETAKSAEGGHSDAH